MVVLPWPRRRGDGQESGRAAERERAGRLRPRGLAAHRRGRDASRSSPARSRSARTSAPRSPRPWPRSCARRSTTIQLVMGDTDLTPFDMGTFGSRTTPAMAPQLRKAAAAARELLKDLAAARVERRPRARSSWPTGSVSDPPARPRARLRRADQGPEARANDRRRRCRRPPPSAGRSPASSVAEGERPRHRDRPPPLHVRHRRGPGCCTARCCGRPPSGATLVSLDTARPRRRCRAWSWCTTAIRRRRRAERSAAAARPSPRSSPKWKADAAAVGPGALRPSCASTTGRPARARRRPTSSARCRRRCAQPRSASKRPTPSPTSPTSRSSRGPRWPSGTDGRLTVWTGHAAAVRRAERAGRGLPSARGQGPRDRARHRLGLRRQAHGRMRDRGGAAGQGGGPAGEGGLDARGGVPLGLLPPGRRHRREERRRRPTGKLSAWEIHNYNSGASGDPHALRRRRTSASSSTPPTRRCARARTAGSPRPRTTSPASRTWTSWPRRRGARPARVPPPEPEGSAAAGGARGRRGALRLGDAQGRARVTATASPAASRRAATSPPAPRSRVRADGAVRVVAPAGHRLRVRRRSSTRTSCGTRSKARC